MGGYSTCTHMYLRDAGKCVHILYVPTICCLNSNGNISDLSLFARLGSNRPRVALQRTKERKI